MDESDHLTLVGDEEVGVRRREREGVAGGKEEGVVARALSLSHTCGHTGRARTVLDCRTFWSLEGSLSSRSR